MIWDIEGLLDELGKALASTLKDLDEGRVTRTHRVVGDGILKVTTRVSVGPLTPESARSEPLVQEPIVDVFDDKKGLRVLVELPGVRKEDVKVRFLNGVLRIDVTKGGKLHRRELPCKVAPGSVEVKSTRENNSVVEITFLRRPRGDKE